MLFLSNAFVFTIIQLNYEVNKEKITALFCVNKDKPMTICYGSCYLKKQLENTKEKQEESGFQIHEMPIMQLPVLPSVEWAATTFPIVKNYSTYLKFYAFLNQADIFHPPRTI